MALDRHARHEHCLTNVNNISVLDSASKSPLPPGQTQTKQDDNLKTDLRQNKFSKLCPVLGTDKNTMTLCTQVTWQ